MEENQSFLEQVGFGVSQLPEVSQVVEEVTPPTQKPSTAAVKGKSHKGKNWSSLEDKVLIEAWANTSLDAVVGSDQNSTAYWARIASYYDNHKESTWPERNANAINCRYTVISTLTSRFSACVQQILNRNESGRTIQEKVCTYLVIYL